LALRLHTVICSTRPGRIGPAVARWFHGAARAHGGFDAHLVDLADFDLPLLDEPEHPRLQNYRNAHTKAWSASVAAADAFVLVTPEYNYSAPPALVNALHYLSREWNYKPAAFVSYGGISGGIRAVQAEKLILTTLKMVPLLEAVTIPWVTQLLDAEKKVFTPNEVIAGSVAPMLEELARWAAALKPLRG